VSHLVRVSGIRAVAIALITSACSSGERRPSDSSAAAGSAAASASQAAPAAQLAQAQSLPGALAKPLEQYTGDELDAFVRGLRFTGGVERQRRCREAGCAGPQPAQSVQVRVDAVDAQDSISAQALPPNGVVVARATSRGQGTEQRYGMRPGPANSYYLVVLRVGQTATATWRLVELTTTGAQHAHRTVATGSFVECRHPFVRGSRADFKTCAEAAVRPAAFGRFLQDPDPPIWLSCASGCCTADPGGRS
jgi:hypothetical protein